MSFDKYNHSEVENRIYKYWEKNNLFKPKKNKKRIYFFFDLTQHFFWRQRPESNRDTRICNPLRNHSATLPYKQIINQFGRCLYNQFYQLVYKFSL